MTSEFSAIITDKYADRLGACLTHIAKDAGQPYIILTFRCHPYILVSGASKMLQGEITNIVFNMTWEEKLRISSFGHRKQESLQLLVVSICSTV